MKGQISLFTAAALGLACTLTAAAQQPAASKRLAATIDTRETAAPISEYLYGGFIEHVGSLIYRSLWSEMLDDRKFYFDQSQSRRKPNGQAALQPWRLRKWRPWDATTLYQMDKDRPFVGDQSPRIALDASTPHGIRQSPAFPSSSGKRYIGPHLLRGTPGAKVK